MNHIWLGRLGSNQRMPESKSGALPLGYAPIKQKSHAGFYEKEDGVSSGARTHDLQGHNLAL